MDRIEGNVTEGLTTSPNKKVLKLYQLIKNSIQNTCKYCDSELV